MPPLETFLGLPAAMWAFMTFAAIAATVIGALVHEFFIMTSFAKKARKLKFVKGLPAMIQFANTVRLIFSDADLPEGLHHMAGQWFMRSQTPYLGTAKRGPGRPSKEEKKANDEQKGDPLNKDERDTLDMILQTPTLEGVGKPIFFGCINQPLLGNLPTIAHANLPKVKEIIPATLTQTQLDALHTYSKIKGLKMMGKDTKQFFLYVLGAICVIACLGLVVYLILQGGK